MTHFSFLTPVTIYPTICHGLHSPPCSGLYLPANLALPPMRSLTLYTSSSHMSCDLICNNLYTWGSLLWKCSYYVRWANVCSLLKTQLGYHPSKSFPELSLKANHCPLSAMPHGMCTFIQIHMALYSPICLCILFPPTTVRCCILSSHHSGL